MPQEFRGVLGAGAVHGVFLPWGAHAVRMGVRGGVRVCGFPSADPDG
jgi:hypothetical protein